MTDLEKQILVNTESAFDYLEGLAIAISSSVDEEGGNPDYVEDFELTPFTDAIVSAAEALADLRFVVKGPSEAERIVKIYEKNNAE